MKTLMELQNHFQFKTDKQLHHFYLEEYDKWFLSRKYKQGRILELGVAEGGSLLLWNKYFPNMKIVGLDINPLGSDVYGHPPAVPVELPPNVSFLQKNGYESDTVRQLAVHEYDIIIDDGPHTTHTQQFAITHYHKLIKSGLLIIEDVPRVKLFTLLETCYSELRHRLFQLTVVDHVNARNYPPDRSIWQNWGNVPLQQSGADDILLCVEFFG